MERSEEVIAHSQVESKFPMQSHLACFNAACRARFDINDVLYNCPNAAVCSKRNTTSPESMPPP